MSLEVLNVFENAKTGEFLLVVFLLVVGIASVLVTGSIPAGEDAGDTFILLTIGYFVAGLAAYGGFTEWRELRLIRNTPTSKIRSMAMGTVELKGTAEQGPEDMILESPFSGEDCLFYRYQIEEYRQQGKNSSWVTISQGKEGVRFVLDDGTGEVIVDPDGAELEIPPEGEIRVNSEEQETEEIREFLNQEGISGPGGLIGDNDRRYKEWFVSPGEEVYVFGYASTENDDKGEYPIIKHDDREEMFMISDRSEKELRRSKKWESIFLVVGGASGTVALYGALLAFTGVL